MMLFRRSLGSSSPKARLAMVSYFPTAPYDAPPKGDHRQLFGLPGEQNEVAVWITYDERSCPPWLASEGLDEFHARRFILQKERLRVIERNGSGE